MFPEEDVQFLTKIGFTKTQIRLYLMLLTLGEADARTISKSTEVPSAAVYRTLAELQKKGLVEKVIATPYKFKATPLDFGLQLLMVRHTRQHLELQRELKEFFIRRKHKYVSETPQEEEYKLTMVEGKDRILQIKQIEHGKVQRCVDMLSTLQRWLQFLDNCCEEYKGALARKVKYRLVIQAPAEGFNFQDKAQAIISDPNFELRFSTEPLICNLAVFDERQASINFFPSKSVLESPLILTNHPSFIQMCQDHFETVWRSSQKSKINF